MVTIMNTVDSRDLDAELDIEVIDRDLEEQSELDPKTVFVGRILEVTR